jgi:predicted AAA+ superfamily ATPase
LRNKLKPGWRGSGRSSKLKARVERFRKKQQVETGV